MGRSQRPAQPNKRAPMNATRATPLRMPASTAFSRISENTTEDTSSKRPKDVVRVDRSGGRCRGERRELFGTDPHPEATDAHLDLQVDRGACPHELREGLSARRADEGRGAAVVKS